MRSCRKKIAWLQFVLCAVLLSACDQQPPADRLSEGRPFPPLTLTGFSGEQFSLDDDGGRLVILNVWATWCGPCRQELGALERLSKSLDSKAFSVLGLSVDTDRHNAREFLRERGVTYRNFIDPSGEISRDLLDIRAYPSTYVISPQGVLLRRVVGAREWDDPGIVAALRAAATGDLAGLALI